MIEREKQIYEDKPKFYEREPYYSTTHRWDEEWKEYPATLEIIPPTCHLMSKRFHERNNRNDKKKKRKSFHPSYHQMPQRNQRGGKEKGKKTTRRWSLPSEKERMDCRIEFRVGFSAGHRVLREKAGDGIKIKEEAWFLRERERGSAVAAGICLSVLRRYIY